jgi:hypothetical protein
MWNLALKAVETLELGLFEKLALGLIREAEGLKIAVFTQWTAQARNPAPDPGKDDVGETLRGSGPPTNEFEVGDVDCPKILFKGFVHNLDDKSADYYTPPSEYDDRKEKH